MGYNKLSIYYIGSVKITQQAIFKMNNNEKTKIRFGWYYEKSS